MEPYFLTNDTKARSLSLFSPAGSNWTIPQKGSDWPALAFVLTPGSIMAVRGMGADSSKASFPCWNPWLVACPEPEKLAKGGLPKASMLDSLETADAHFVIITFPFHMWGNRHPGCQMSLLVTTIPIWTDFESVSSSLHDALNSLTNFRWSVCCSLWLQIQVTFEFKSVFELWQVTWSVPHSTLSSTCFLPHWLFLAYF